MTMTVTALKRDFVDGKTGITYPDPNPSYTPEQVREFLSTQYPHLVNAKIEGPEILKSKIKFVFTTSIGTKG
jgi:PRTRC genetic system protein C